MVSFSWEEKIMMKITSFSFMTPSPEGLLLSDTLMKSKTVLENKDHEDALHQGEPMNGPLDHPPKGLLPPEVDH